MASTEDGQSYLGTVLLVDDEVEILDLEEAALNGGRLKVLRAGGAEEAIVTATGAQASIDLLVTDIMLAGESGTTLARRFRQMYPSAGILFTSGFEAGTYQQATAEVGVEYLAKPFRLAEFAKQVTRMVAAAHQQRMKRRYAVGGKES